MTTRNPSAVATFLRLWAVLLFAYALLRVAFNLVVFRWIDIRPVVLLDLAVIPLGQAMVFWFVTRRGRRANASEPSTDGSV